MKRKERNIIYKNHLAGVQYSDYQRVAGIRAGRKIELWHERSNRQDKNAIKVTLDGVHIGYIKRECTGLFHGFHASGTKIFGEIVSYNRNNPSWQLIVVRCWVEQEIPEDVKLS